MDLISNSGCGSDIDEHGLSGYIDFDQLELNLDLKRNVSVGGVTESKKLMRAANHHCIHTLFYYIFIY